ncbi:hypothetical protein, partial [Bradyrhizobium sp.]|uniref:hypothetical protein n=1 Tax=Bradyrhizobium sp. TaxID=376 RepID=UPI0027325110
AARPWRKPECGGFGKFGAARTIGGGSGERGRRRTRQDQISLWTQDHSGFEPPVKLRIMRSAPNEETLFLLPNRFSKERALLKERSSRLT